jgi:hypothetical protein
MPTKHAASEALHAIVQKMSECTHRQTAGHVLLSNVKLLAAGKDHILAEFGGGGTVRCTLPACVAVFSNFNFCKVGTGGTRKKKKLNKDTLYIGSLYCF